ncbi:MAG TPA: RidA family protein [Burkholderiaceae bacterium]|nr:RidA family protein [Burkholderiaceae bacterium]
MTTKPESPQLTRTVLRSGVLPKPRFRYSPIVKAGPFIFISGMVGLDPSTGALAEGGAYQQTRQILGNFTKLCQEQHWSLNQLLVARIFCADADGAAAVNEAWEEVFAEIEPPARTFVTVSALPLGAAVEIEFQLLLTKAE